MWYQNENLPHWEKQLQETFTLFVALTWKNKEKYGHFWQPGGHYYEQRIKMFYEFYMLNQYMQGSTPYGNLLIL